MSQRTLDLARGYAIAPARTGLHREYTAGWGEVEQAGGYDLLRGAEAPDYLPYPAIPMRFILVMSVVRDIPSKRAASAFTKCARPSASTILRFS